MEMKRNQKGSITLEATIFLTMFLCAYLCLINLIQLARVQVILQYATTQTAKEIAQNTYLLSKMGIVDKSMTTSSKAEKFKDETDKMIESVMKFYEALGNTANSDPNADPVGSMSSIPQIGADAYDEVTNYFSDTDEIMLGLIALLKTGIQDLAKTQVVEYATKGCVKQQIECLTNQDAEAYLEKLGVVDGFEGLDFSNSKWFHDSGNGVPEVLIVVDYKIKYKFAFIEINELNFRVCAKTVVW